MHQDLKKRGKFAEKYLPSDHWVFIIYLMLFFSKSVQIKKLNYICHGLGESKYFNYSFNKNNKEMVKTWCPEIKF